MDKLILIQELHEISQSDDLSIKVVGFDDNLICSLKRKDKNEETNEILKLILNETVNLKYSDFGIKRNGGKREIKVNSRKSERMDGLESHVGTAVKTVILRGTAHKDKMSEVTLSGKKESLIQKAARDYEKWCLDNGMQPNQSKVHSFADTIQQARILTIPARDADETYKIAFLTYMSHLYDDMIDSDTNLPEQYNEAPRSFREFRDDNKSLKKVLTKSLSFSSNRNERKNILTGFLDILDGALIQQSNNYYSQKRYSEDFKAKILHSIRNPAIRDKFSRMHPMLISLMSHVDFDLWFGLEKGNNNPDLAKLYSSWTAPAVYCHDRKEEIDREGFRLIYGKELDSEDKGFIGDKYLIQMIDSSEGFLIKEKDNRKKEHLKELNIAYKAFKDTIPKAVRNRYEESLKRLEDSLIN